MRTTSYFLFLFFFFSSFMIDQSFAPQSVSRKGKGKAKQTGPAPVQKLNTLCHILNYGEFDNAGITTHVLNDPDEPIKKYQTGYHDRVEYVHAVVTPQNIGKGSATTPATRTYARSMGNDKDDAGHIIASQLGGSGKKNYNIFPQNLSINRGKWRSLEKQIRDTVKSSNQPIHVVVQLYYSSPQATRPDRFIYRAAFGQACHTALVTNSPTKT